MRWRCPRYPTPMCNGEMQPHSAPCLLSGTAPLCPVPTALSQPCCSPRPRAMGWHLLSVPPSSPCPRQGAGTAPWCPTPHFSAEAPRFESIMEDIDAQEGETPRFAVVVEGKPLPDIMWYKVGWDPPPPPDPQTHAPCSPPLPRGPRVGALALCHPNWCRVLHPCWCGELVGGNRGPPDTRCAPRTGSCWRRAAT